MPDRNEKIVGCPDEDCPVGFGMNDPEYNPIDYNEIIESYNESLLEDNAIKEINGFFYGMLQPSYETRGSFAVSKDEMRHTERIQVPYSKKLSEIGHLSKNLYNFANFLTRQIYFNKTRQNYKIHKVALPYLRDFLFRGTFLGYPDSYHIIKNLEHYKKLPAQTAQQTLIKLAKNWKAYWEGIKKWREKSHKSSGRPCIPGFKKKSGEFMVIFTGQQLQTQRAYDHYKRTKRTTRYKKYSKTTGELLFPKKVNLNPIRTRISIEKINEVRIIPKGSCYVIEVVYPKGKEDVRLDNNKIAAIDLGVNNLLTIVNNIGKRPIIVKGKVVKSINQFTHKQIAKLRSKRNKQGIFKESIQERRIWEKRENRIHDYFHKTSRFVIRYCIYYHISTIVIGYNLKWKQNINLGDKNNQNFSSIPFLKLIEQIAYKAELVGINVIVMIEHFTSQTCCYCGRLNKTNRYKGLYRCDHCGIEMHSDVNGAINNGRLKYPDAFEKFPPNRLFFSPLVACI
ncbi:MAG: RNA-guided endonuclease InsQ/TnpB family protein [Candidatus Hodarchaeota archaeon]